MILQEELVLHASASGPCTRLSRLLLLPWHDSLLMAPALQWAL